MAKKTKETKPENWKPEGRPVAKEVTIKLTPQQLAERSKQSAQLGAEEEEAEAEFEVKNIEFKKVRAEHKSNMKQLKEQRRKLDREFRTKTATIIDTTILCLNHDAGVAEYWYQTDGKEWEIIETRPLEDNERQTSFIKDQVSKMPETGQEVTA